LKKETKNLSTTTKKERTRTVTKCAKMKNASTRRGKLLFSLLNMQIFDVLVAVETFIYFPFIYFRQKDRETLFLAKAFLEHDCNLVLALL